jgi:hypothetical protein
MKDEALKMALEALETCDGGTSWADPYQRFDPKLVKKAITAIKQALAAQPAPVQPVAWIDLLKKAEEVVRSKPLWKKYIDGTPLANDIAVWMANFAQENAAAQPAVQEPFGYVYEVYCLPECALEMEWVEGFDRYEPDAKNNIRNVTPVYTNPPAAQPAVQEPVGEVTRYGLDSHGRKWHGIHWYDSNVDVPHGTKLYTTPPAQRHWVWLTDAEVMQTMSGDWTSQFYFARAIEAKLKEKNNG